MFTFPTTFMASVGGWWLPPVTFTYATWNSADKSADIALSNWDLTITHTWTGWDGVRSTISKSSWKWYYEVTIDAWTYESISGIALSSATLTNFLWSDANWYWYYGWTWAKTNSWLTAYGATYNVWDVIGIAIDLDGNSMEFFKNNVSQWVAFTWLTWTYFAMSSVVAWVSMVTTTNFWATPMTYTAPSWYNQWLYE